VELAALGEGDGAGIVEGAGEGVAAGDGQADAGSVGEAGIGGDRPGDGISASLADQSSSRKTRRKTFGDGSQT
jgi:hypothetical protein